MRLPSGRIYLDHNATTPMADRVADALARAGRECFGNASNAYAEGRAARAALDAARGQVAALIGCEPDEIVFTGSATEADHLAVTSAARAAGDRKRVLFSAIEHPAVFDQRQALVERGFAVDLVPVRASGELDIERLEALMGRDVALVAVLAAHNETGVLQPLEAVGTLCERFGALFLTDAVQSLGKVASPWRSARPHYLAVAAHKLYGPKGIGALAVRRGAPLFPMLVGGGQEGGRRSSTEAVPLAVAFGEACALAGERLDRMDGFQELRDAMEGRLREAFGAVVHGLGAPRLPNTSFFSLPGVSGPDLAARLDEEGLAVATGSACHSTGSHGPRVLDAMGTAPELMGSVLRVSLGHGSESRDILTFLNAVSRIVLDAGARQGA